MFVGVAVIKLNKSDVEYLNYAHSIVVYQKYLTRLGEVIIFPPRCQSAFKMENKYHKG